VQPELAVIVPSIGLARARETVESIDASARAGGLSAEIVLAWQSQAPPPALPASARVLEVLPIGVSYARNRPLRGITAPLVAFVDDDELVDRDWAGALVSAFTQNPGIGAVCGAIAPLDDRGLAYCSFDGGEERRYSGASTQPWVIGGGGNMAVRRELLERLRGFDLLFGRGTVSLSAEDSELIGRILRAGEEVLWTPDAVVYHPTKSEQERLESRRPYGYGMGKLVRRHRDISGGAKYASYAVQSFLAGTVQRSRRRRREALATLRAFLAGASRRSSWVAPMELFSYLPQELRADVDVSRVQPLPPQYRPNPHFVYVLDAERVLHVYAAPSPELKTALADREVIRSESQVDGIPRVLSWSEGLDSLWVVEERVGGGVDPGDLAVLRASLEWATAMASPLGGPLGGQEWWSDFCSGIVGSSPPGVRDAAAAACARLGALRSAHAHGDYQRKNVLLDGGRVRVLDWELARARDLPGADLLFYAVTAGGAPDPNTVARLARGEEPLDVPLRPLLAELGVDDDDTLRDLLLVLLVRWAANERRRLAQWGARAEHARYAELLERCGPVVGRVPAAASLS
jgi:GT2 family glycosyltransferase